MKKKFILFFALTICIFSANAQTQINEGFTSPWITTGWFLQNNSVPVGTASWFQGVSLTFPAYNGGPDDYVAVNYDSQGNTAGGISNWLITPTVTLVNGATFKFATRTTTSTPVYPDRLQVRLSQGTGTTVGTGTASVGSFNTLLFDINPGLTTSGYPTSWTVYTATLSGITGTVAGRFAFRYFVDDGGPNGTNSNYIGIDDVIYTLPTGCNPPVVTINPTSPSVCGGGSANLTASGAANYTWSTGSNASSINVSPSSTTVYTVSGSNLPGCVGVATTTVNVVSAPVISTTGATVCSQATSVLTASGASSYTWSTGSNSSSITVNPASNTTYTVTGSVGSCTASATAAVVFTTAPNVSVSNATACPNTAINITASGATTYTWSNGWTSANIQVSTPVSVTLSVTGFNGPSCSDTKTLAVNVNTFLTAPGVTACPNAPVALVANGAVLYNWSNGATTSSIVITPTANTSYTVTGNNGTCVETKTVNVTIDPNITVPNHTTCAGTAATLIATGATSYTWSDGSSSSIIVVTPTANTIYTVTGSNGTCSQTKTVSVTIGANLSVNASYTCVGTQIALTASGASSYTWLPGGQNSSGIIFTPTAAAIYTVNGSSGTCLGSTTVNVAYCAGVNENLFTNHSMVVYPNPFANELNISGAYGDVQVINSLGQVILTTTVEESTVISTENLTPGIYFVRVINTKNNNDRKMIRVVRN